ncbi:MULTISPECIES: DUF3987 domain-containing protein [unclassified Xanthomonas]|uniref:DUF3987 domain-containing protein n=1 Tax=unclassified Xanthomonas TaxID=2643310 RepID=UPI000CEE5CDC|nr:MULTISPECIES: DUF3987 domain-containing protein [unclassified Xanthomonas]PPU36959.1 hypothetical protein XspCFBP7912_03735 [Xanthomonas sp. CFBP 7912]RJS02150.1 hypothetical protein XnspCFBP7698_19390 [Xanthomonas sp. CFBP 7698]
MKMYYDSSLLPAGVLVHGQVKCSTSVSSTGALRLSDAEYAPMADKPYAFPFGGVPQFGQFRLPTYQAAVLEATEDHQTPKKMAYYIAATACCAAAQGMFDVEKPRGGRVGLSMYTLICAKSGERKTVLDNEFFRAFTDMNDELSALEAAHVQQLQGNLRAWTRKYRALNAKYAALAKEGRDTADIDDQIRQHEMNKPEERGRMKLMFKDANVQVVKNGLAALPSVAWLSGDSWKLLNEVILPSDADLCDIWSNQRIDVARITTDSFVVMEPRLAKCLMLQPDKLKGIMAGRGKASIDSGYMARILFSWVGTTQGQRLSRIGTVSKACRDRFTQNLKTLLGQYIDLARAGECTRTTLKFSPQAAYVWMKYLDYVEYEIREGGRYHSATDHASKLADVVARLAAAFHVTERFESDIGEDCVLAAIALCDEGSKDYMEYIVPKDQEGLDALKLYDWMVKKFRNPIRRTRINRFIDLREISNLMKFCPYKLRGAHVHRLLGRLEDMGRVRIAEKHTDRGGLAATVELLAAEDQRQQLR